MAIADAAAQFAATVLASLQTRVELAATEVEEHSLRYFGTLVLTLAAMFFAGLAIVMGTLLLIVTFWESSRVVVLSVLTLLFAVAGFLLARQARVRMAHQPKLLAHTVGELGRDAELLQPPA
ncbi:phage holin family protein [Noviherbaspirillum galbum]|uniref:Phage holin family protein n=1 Tax=Noviherbaspirillum galbum TaxID=2709383 RepID=A0A6B3SLS6_9BURK|nr:phage holin family protein [Noviherbaspirillum galbum]NEX61438.1 hypothetical protein [Noviherbaspirillum galbum]